MRRQYTNYKFIKNVKNEKKFFNDLNKLNDRGNKLEVRLKLIEFFEDELHVYWSRMVISKKIIPYLLGLTLFSFFILQCLFLILTMLSIIMIIISLCFRYNLKKTYGADFFAMSDYNYQVNEEYGTNFSWK